MRKSILLAIIGALVCVGLSFSTSYANVDCFGVDIKSVGTTTFTPSGLFIKVTNNTKAACGALGVGDTLQYFVVDDATTDRIYATLLTGRSLGAKLFISVAGTGTNNSLLFVASILL